MTLPDRQIVPSDSLGYSKLYLDFIAGRSPAVDFYPAESLAAVAHRLDSFNHSRDALADIVLDQNRSFGAGTEALANIELLRDKNALCVFTGQQAGLFGGPLLTLIKGLAVVKAAKQYSRELDRPVIPIFWIAGDDHDFEEANHTYVLNRSGEVCKIAYASAPPLELPTAEIALSDKPELTKAIDQLRECLGETDFTDELYSAVEASYTSEATLVSAFGGLMSSLTNRYGLVFFNPGDARAKALAAPFFEQILSLQSEVTDALVSRNQEIQAAGYHLQVEKKDEAAHLFYNDGGRRPVSREGDHFVCGDKQLTETELRSLIENHPERFSPDVLTRPLMQSFLFPTLSQRCGAAELAYLAQLNPLFELFGLVAPWHRPRPSLTVLEKRAETQMAEMSISLEDLTGDIEQVVNAVLNRSFPPDLEHDFDRMQEAVRERFKMFRNEALEFDPGLKNVGEQTGGKIDFILKGFGAKLFAAHKKKSKQTRDRIYRLHQALYPNQGLQERSLNISYFLARYGRKFIDHLYDNLETDSTDHQLLPMSRFEAE